MRKLRKKFTKWYIKRGYNITVYYDTLGVFSYWPACPWWVKPFAKYLLSPSVFQHEHAKQCAASLSEGFLKGLRSAGVIVDESYDALVNCHKFSKIGRDA